jgi:hypothetical protein
MTNMEAQLALETLHDRVNKMREEVNNYIQANGSERLKKKVAKKRKVEKSSFSTQTMVKFGAVFVWIVSMGILILGSAKGF